MKLSITAFLLAVAITLCFTGCSLFGGKDKKSSSAADPEQNTAAEENLEYPLSLCGAELDSRPGVVVSLSPALTERLLDLGLDDRLEGVSDFDEASGSLVACGTAQAPALDAIKTLAPHLLLTETPFSPDDEQALADMGVAVALIPHASNIDGVMENYRNMAILLDGKKTGAALGDAFNKKISQRLAEVSQNALPEPKNAVYLMRLDYTMATGDTLESELMGLAGFKNIAEAYTGWTYPEEEANSAEGKANFASLDFIFCDRRGVTMKMMENSAFFKGLNAVRKDYYLYIDSTAFERQSLRMFDELDRMRQYAMGELEGGASQEQ